MTNDRMRVEFQASFDELVEACLSAYRRSGRMRRGLLRSWAFQVLAAGPTAYLMAAYGPRAWWAGAVGLVLSVLVGFPFLYGGSVRRSLRADCRKRLGGRDHFLAEFEIGPEGVWIRSAGEEGVVGWEEVEGVEEVG